MAPLALVAPGPDDWERVRELRLRMVTDTPDAFLETREQVLARTEDEWRTQIAERTHAGSMRLVAVAPDGAWVGTMSCFLSSGSPGYVIDPRPGPERANLVGVFVDPAWRGRAAGVTGLLLDAVVAWVRDRGLDALHLHVDGTNERALRAYRARGFVETGVIDATAEKPGADEVEMVLGIR